MHGAFYKIALMLPDVCLLKSRAYNTRTVKHNTIKADANHDAEAVMGSIAYDRQGLDVNSQWAGTGLKEGT